MREYVCCACGADFLMPLTVQEDVPGGDTVQYDVCPYCKSEEFILVEECRDCRHTMPEGNILCARCRERLRRKLRQFLLGLTPAEKELLENWTDGTSILEAADMEDQND